MRMTRVVDQAASQRAELAAALTQVTKKMANSTPVRCYVRGGGTADSSAVARRASALAPSAKRLKSFRPALPASRLSPLRSGPVVVFFLRVERAGGPDPLASSSDLGLS